MKRVLAAVLMSFAISCVSGQQGDSTREVPPKQKSDCWAKVYQEMCCNGDSGCNHDICSQELLRHYLKVCYECEAVSGTYKAGACST